MQDKPPIPLTKDETRDALKEALREWLSEQLARFGWWSLRGIAAMGLVAITYLVLMWHGWRPPS